MLNHTNLAAATERYLDELARWNKTYNLTAITQRDEMRVKHVADSLAVLPFLDAQAPQQILDVGSGAGLPGILLALARPQWQVTCLDTVGKKCTFMRHAARSLGLSNVTVVHARIEDYHQPHDAIISRAFASVGDFLNITAHCGTSDTRWWAMKGQLPADELAQIPTGFVLAAQHTVTVEGLSAQRCLLELRRAPTP
mgnify:FL=1